MLNTELEEKSIWFQNKKGDYLDNKNTYYLNFISIKISFISSTCDCWVSLVMREHRGTDIKNSKIVENWATIP